MDPNTALAVLRGWARAKANGTENVYATDDDAVEAFNALDQWLERGGYLPTPWDGPRHPRPTTATGGGL